MKQPGFMIYAEDWGYYMEDYSDEEIGRMLRALLLYFDTQEETLFSDRGMRQFFRMASKGIDMDVRRYTEKCRQNAYIRYKAVCKQQHEKPLSFEEWAAKIDERQRTSTNVDERRPASPIPTPESTANPQPSETNPQPSENNKQKSKTVLSKNESRAPAFPPDPLAPLNAEEFEKRREQAIASLRLGRQCPL